MSETTAPTLVEEKTMSDAGQEATGTSIAETIRDKIGQTGSELKDQALGKAREYAATGKEKATDVLDSMAKLVGDAASTLDDKIGGVGEYAHNAAGAISNFAESLRSKDFEELIDDAKAAVKRNPAIAIGAAAVAGFVLVRLIKSAGGSGERPSGDQDS